MSVDLVQPSFVTGISSPAFRVGDIILISKKRWRIAGILSGGGGSIYPVPPRKSKGFRRHVRRMKEARR